MPTGLIHCRCDPDNLQINAETPHPFEVGYSVGPSSNGRGKLRGQDPHGLVVDIKMLGPILPEHSSSSGLRRGHHQYGVDHSVLYLSQRLSLALDPDQGIESVRRHGRIRAGDRKAGKGCRCKGLTG
jgi:hypothetical protein